MDSRKLPESPPVDIDALQLFADYRILVDQALDATLPPDEALPAGLHASMRYSVFAGGKRLRPILVLAAGEACGADTVALLREVYGDNVEHRLGHVGEFLDRLGHLLHGG